MGRKVTKVAFGAPELPRDKNVAAYCRVSSSKDAMLHSLEAQVSYYSSLIQNHSGWEYAGVYADEARTGTKDTRENFVRLLADCRAGKIDMVLTKSISRFARNTVMLLETVRELKQIGVDVYFEEQNIHSLSTDGELMLTVLASYAQEESRSASENQKWRIKKNFEEGKPWSSTLLGYRNVDGRFEIVPEEAETVRMIFDWYLEGMGATAIRDRLNAMGIKTRLGNRWSRSPILKLLRNYAYTGNLLLQRTYRENHITKKCIKNTGEKPMYHAENTHEAIIDMDTFNQVQEEMKRRAEHFKHKEGTEMKTYPFTGLVRCACCGKNYVRSGAPAYRTWTCRTRRREGLKNCGADIIPEDELFRLTAEVIGGEVTEDAVRDKITAIRAEENRTLVFRLKNGKETVKQWQEHEVMHICTEEQKRQISLKNSGRKRTEEQLTSYEAQVDYYTNYIKSRPEWEFVDVYTDEGISATDTRHRSGFNKMVQDALDGKIDLIVTKSVSRFARNTVDSLTTVRKLKEKGVEVYFQKENIYTLDSKGELLITIMSSLAQEESRSISENVTWGKRKRFADGKVSLAYSSFLGYRKGEGGQMEVVPEEAETVRLIYRLFMQGQTPYAIAKYLTDKNIPTPTGKETWRHRTVENILSNEKYKGDARLQKCYTVDFLSKKRKANEGEVPQYYVEGSHDAIIEPAEWQLVQMEMRRRKNTGRSHNCCSPFSAKLKCGDCGEYFGSKVWHSNSKYKRTIWQCNAKFKGESRCATPHLYEQRIKELFLEALGILMENRETVIGDCRAVMEALADCSAIDAELEAVSSEMEVTAGLIQKLVDENATQKLDQHDYRKKYDGYASRYAALESRMDSLEKERERKESQYDIFSGFLAGLSETEELPVDFNEKLFHRLVDYATVYHDGRVVFAFRNGVEVSTEI